MPFNQSLIFCRMNVNLNSEWSCEYVIILKIQKIGYINSIVILTCVQVCPSTLTCYYFLLSK